ncbi:MAG: photosynthetic reaction center subunit H [Gammaproteobacteria bacterium]|nr:PRC-barrel domain-containing protein [Pseudomonadales bacterium]MCP5347027.1 PRC-barrel domain-containing protein [Pseudomonadales bacterium]
MPIGEITGYIDVAQLVLYAFWLFFFGLIYYLRKEDKREGYPLVADPAVPSEQHKTRMEGFPPMPDPKVFRLADGSTRVAPREDRDPDGLKAEPMESWPGSPLLPTGNPMRDGVGPAAYAQRPDEPEKTLHGKPRMAPLRLAVDFHVEARDPDPRGMDVVGADGRSAGEIVDIWIDRSEPQIRYLEVSVHGSAPAPAVSDAEEGQSPPPPKNRRVLLPIHFTRIDGQRRQVRVKSILAGQFADVPVLRNPDQVTQLEEDRITAYYGSGHLYALADRQEPWL